MVPEFVRRRRTLALLALLLVIVGLALVVHTPPARRAVLEQAIALLQHRLNVVLRAESLDYNLLTLRVTLTGVDLAGITTPDVPFAHADVLSVDLPWSALYSPFTLDRVALENARVHIIRRLDGTTNLPPSGTSATGEPAPIAIGGLTIPRLAIEVSDEPSDLTITLPALRVEVQPDSGVLRLLTPGRVQKGDQRTEIAKLEGQVSFDGRVVALSHLALVTSEAALVADGSIPLLVAEPHVNLRVSGTSDIDRAARWAMDEPRPAGMVSFDGTLAGAIAAPRLTVRLQSEALAWQGLTASNVRGGLDLDLDRRRLHVADVEAIVADGLVTIDAEVPLQRSEVSLTASWTDLDARALVRALAPDLPVRPSGRASGTASMKGTGGDLALWDISARNRMVGGRIAPEHLPLEGTATLGISNGMWRLVADQRVAGVPVHAAVSGRLSGEKVSSSTIEGVLRIGDTDVARLIGTLSAATIVNLAPGGRGTLSADAVLAGTLGAPHVQITAHARDVSAGGVDDLQSDLTATGALDSLAVDARIRQDPGNVVHVTGTVFPRTARFDARATGRLEDPSRLARVPVAGVVDVAFDGSGPFGAPSGRGTLTMAGLIYGMVPLGPVQSTIELDGGTARIKVTFDDFRASADARVTIAAPHETTVDVRVSEADLARVARDHELPSSVTGLVSLVARASGHLDEWRRGTATVEVSRFEARAGELSLRLLDPARATYADGIARIDSLEAAIGETHASLAGALPILEGAASVTVTDALRATLTGDLAQALSALRAAGFVDLPPVSGRGPIALLARVTGSAQAPVLAANVELGPGSLGFEEWPAVSPVQLRARLEGGWLELYETVGEWQGAQIAADGRLPITMLDAYLPAAVVRALPPAIGEGSLNARATSLTPRVLEPFLTPETIAQLEGTVDASVQLTSPSLELEDLRGEMRLDRLDLRVANLPVTQREATRIVADGGFARVVAWDWTGEGATLEVQGQVRLQDQQAALLASARVDLRILTPFVRDAGLATAGTLAPRVSIVGPLRDPLIDGQVELSSGEVRLSNPRIITSDLNTRAVLSRTSGQAASITGTVNGGALTGNARFDYGQGQPLSAELSASVRNMALNFPDGFRSELAADLILRLAEDQRTDALGGAVSGTVTVLRGSYREPLAVATGLLTRLRTQRLAATVTSEPESLTERLALNIRVITEEDLSVDNNYGRLELGADLRVIGAAAAPALSGRATLREGGQLFLGRNIYTVESGTFDFTNPTTIEPDMNIVARTRAGGEEIELEIMGTPANLTVEPRAVNTPELGVADVWSLLLTGRKLDDVSGDEAEIVGEQVLGYLSGDVLGLASRAVGIESIRLGGIDESITRRDPAIIAAEVDPTARLTFGQSIGERVDVTFSQNLRDSNAQTWIVDYLPTRQLDLRLVSDDDDLRSYQFRHDVSFGDDRERRVSTEPESRREPRVTHIATSGNLVLPEQRARSVLRLSVGDRFDFAEWQRDRDRLEELYRHEGYREARISAARRESAEAVELSYAIEAGPRTAIDVSGYRLPRSTLEELERSWSEAGFDGFLVDDATSVVRRALAEDGYLRAEITATISNVDTKALSISIASGERTTDYRVRIEAADEALARDLDRWMRDRRLDELAWRDPGALESALRIELQAHGHLRARVARGTPLFEGSVATLPVTVDAGPVWIVSEISLEGARTLYDATLNAVAIEPGAPYDASTVDAARDRVAAAYRRAGFSQVRVIVRPDIESEAERVVLVFQIEEGPRQVLQEVLVSGDRGVDSDVVTRALGVKIGDPLGPETWLQARGRIFETGLFRQVDLTVEPIEASAAEASTQQPMRVVVAVQEWPRLRLRYGFSVQEERPAEEVEGTDLVPGLSADVTRRTLFGRAITVGAAMEYQRRERLGRTFVTAPTFLGLPIASTFTVETSREDFPNATPVTRTGFSWEQRFRFARRLRLSYSYAFERSRTVLRPDPLFPAFPVTLNVGRLTGTAAYDTRDSPADASRGWLLLSSFDYAQEFAGTDFRFVRHLGQAYYFRPWRGAVLASAARVGLVTELGGQDVIPSERFFAGGARTVRGVGEDRLGPTDFFGNPTGGEALLTFNQELRFPIFRWFRGVAFADAGNVFPTVSDFGVRALTGSAGFGLRLATPFVLLRVDYGRLFSPGPTDRSGRWTFGIGQSF